MSLFGNKEDKQQKRMEEYMKKYGLESLDAKDVELIKYVTYDLMGTDLISFGSKAEDSAKISLLQALIEQNWILLRKLESIDKGIQELNTKLATK